MVKFKAIRLLISIILITISNVKAINLYNKNSNTLIFGGSINTGNIFSKGNVNNGDISFVNIHFIGETKITDELIGYATWKYNFLNKNREELYLPNIRNDTNLSFVGLKYGKFGSLDYGRNFSLVYSALSATEILQNFNIKRNSDTFLSGPTNSLFTYRNQNFFGAIPGFDFAFQYQEKNIHFSNRSEIQETNGRGYTICSSYRYNKNITFTTAYSNIRRIEAQNKLKYGKGKHAQIFGTSIKFHSKDLYLATSYSKTLNATPITYGFINKAYTMELTAQYQFLNQISPSIKYVISNGKDVEDNIENIKLHQYISIGSSYKVNQHLFFYAEYKINFIGKHNVLTLPNSNVTSIGLRYKF